MRKLKMLRIDKFVLSCMSENAARKYSQNALLLSSPKLRELFPPNSIISFFCRPKSLKELLAPSKCRKSKFHPVAEPRAAVLHAVKPDVIFVRTSLSTPKLSLAHKLAKHILWGRNSPATYQM